MSKYYKPKLSAQPSGRQNNCSNPPQNFDNIFNTNSSFSISHEISIKPKYFDRLATKKIENDKTDSDIDLPNDTLGHEIINKEYYNINETYNNDTTMIHALNMMKPNNSNPRQNESYRKNLGNQKYPSPKNAINEQYNQKLNNQNGMNKTAQNYQNNNATNQNQRSYFEQQVNTSNYQNFYNQNGQQAQKTPMKFDNTAKIQKEAQMNQKIMEINQLLSKLIPLTDQKKMELMRKTSQISNKEKNTSFLTGKASSTRTDHKSLKILAKIRKDSAVFDLDVSEDSEEETNVNNIFNNNMSYLNSTINGACPGKLLKNNGTTNYSLPINQETSLSVVNYQNRSAGPAFGGYYITPVYSRNFSQQNHSTNKKSNISGYNNKTTNTTLGSERRKIFDRNQSALTNDSKNSIYYYTNTNDEKLCLNCLSYIDKKSMSLHQKNCQKSADQKGTIARKF